MLEATFKAFLKFKKEGKVVWTSSPGAVAWQSQSHHRGKRVHPSLCAGVHSRQIMIEVTIKCIKCLALKTSKKLCFFKVMRCQKMLHLEFSG